MAQNDYKTVDVVLVGAGIMSATLAVLLKELDPSLSLEIVEAMDGGAVESSNPWNNAGTGHAGLCELNYTPESNGGCIDIKKAVSINVQFEESKQFWAYLVDKGAIASPKTFINPIPHLSFVRGEKGLDYLRQRFDALQTHHAFAEMRYSEDRKTLEQWMPLMMPGRDANELIAATHASNGTDVNFGALTQALLRYLERQGNAQVTYNQKVIGLKRNAQGWEISTKDPKSGNRQQLQSRFLFLGAGGGALPLLQMSGIEESKGFGGFPVSGQWLRCDNPEVVSQHQAKVYSQAEVGSPPMSVPHLDTRVVDGKKSLLFGPYAGFSTKFLKKGSYLDLPRSIRLNNIGPMLAVGRDNLDLTRYLIKEVLQSQQQRLNTLRKFYPQAKASDWHLEIAGQRVQIIKKDTKKGGILQFGTELVAAKDGSIAALLGASPGASVTVSIMLGLLQRCFPEQYASRAWCDKLAEIFPAPAAVLSQDAEQYRAVQARSAALLQLSETNAG
jgi:malate dehydrogenase (quinone)